MLIFERITDLQYWLATERKAGKSIGFVPTMGALHTGHTALVEQANSEGCTVVASIFVNPTQFNDPKDLEKYPHTPERDAEMLLKAGCAALFMPPVSEVYPPGKDLTLRINFSPLDEVMEGVFRPGHFNGMATVVKRLLDITQPDRLYMGQKDYQQLSIVRAMLYRLGSTTELVMCATIREEDGLAKSSRNMRLSPEMRQISPVIYATLQQAKQQLEVNMTLDFITNTAMQQLADAGLKPEYFSIVDGLTLLPPTAQSTMIVACVAAWAGEVRLIDNLVLCEAKLA
jgi:pantoate--beta-alanine ligase